MTISIENSENMSLSELAETYNKMAEEIGAMGVHKFSDRATGIRRLKEMHEIYLDQKTESAPDEPKVEEAEEKSEESPKEKTKRQSFSGMRLYPNTDKNPRTKDTIGWKTLEIIMSNPGIIYEDFLAKGGRRLDMAFDVKQGIVLAKNEA